MSQKAPAPRGSSCYWHVNDMHNCWFGILAVSEDASRDEVKKAWKKLWLEFHPDKNPNWARDKYGISQMPMTHWIQEAWKYYSEFRATYEVVEATDEGPLHHPSACPLDPDEEDVGDIQGLIEWNVEKALQDKVGNIDIARLDELNNTFFLTWLTFLTRDVRDRGFEDAMMNSIQHDSSFLNALQGRNRDVNKKFVSVLKPMMTTSVTDQQNQTIDKLLSADNIIQNWQNALTNSENTIFKDGFTLIWNRYDCEDEMEDDEAGAEMEDVETDKQPLTVVGANLCQSFTEQCREILNNRTHRFLVRQYETAAKLEQYQEEKCLNSIRQMEADANDQGSDDSFVQHGLSSADESMKEEMDVKMENAQDQVEVGGNRQVTGEASPVCKKSRQDEPIVISSDESIVNSSGEIPETPSDQE